MALERGVGGKWFTDRVVKKISNGRGTSFWKDRWIGDKPLALAFPRIYSISSQKEATVGDLWNGAEGWILNWRRTPFLWESYLIANLLLIVNRITLGEEED